MRKHHTKKINNAQTIKGNQAGTIHVWFSLLHISAGRRLSMEKVKCPNPKCGRHILDIEQMPPGRTVLEMKCRHCGEIVQVGFSPKKIHKRNRRQE